MADTKIVARPWQPQDLIDDLQGIIDEECDNYLNTRLTTLCMARDYLKDHFAEPKWIPVTERLPENWDERVLVMLPSDCVVGLQNIDTDRCRGKYGKWVRYGDKVTHWMPLPEPPKGE